MAALLAGPAPSDQANNARLPKAGDHLIYSKAAQFARDKVRRVLHVVKQAGIGMQMPPPPCDGVVMMFKIRCCVRGHL